MALYFDLNLKDNHLFPPLAPKFSRNRHQLYREGLLYFNLHSLSENPRFAITLGEIEELISKRVSLEIIVKRLVEARVYIYIENLNTGCFVTSYFCLLNIFIKFSSRIFQAYSDRIDTATDAIRHYAQMLEQKLFPEERKGLSNDLGCLVSSARLGFIYFQRDLI